MTCSMCGAIAHCSVVDGALMCFSCETRYPCSVAIKCGGEVREYRVAIKRRKLCDRCAEWLKLR